VLVHQETDQQKNKRRFIIGFELHLAPQRCTLIKANGRLAGCVQDGYSTIKIDAMLFKIVAARDGKDSTLKIGCDEGILAPRRD
jgi:hypothetical protein